MRSQLFSKHIHLPEGLSPRYISTLCHKYCIGITALTRLTLDFYPQVPLHPRIWRTHTPSIRIQTVPNTSGGFLRAFARCVACLSLISRHGCYAHAEEECGYLRMCDVSSRWRFSCMPNLWSRPSLTRPSNA